MNEEIALRLIVKKISETSHIVDEQMLGIFAKILAEETTDAFLKGVRHGKGYKEEGE